MIPTEERIKELKKVSRMLEDAERFYWEGGSIEYELRCFVTVLFGDDTNSKPDYLFDLLTQEEK